MRILVVWLRWLAYALDGHRNATLFRCMGCDTVERPWPLPRARHAAECQMRGRAWRSEEA